MRKTKPHNEVVGSNPTRSISSINPEQSCGLH